MHPYSVDYPQHRFIVVISVLALIVGIGINQLFIGISEMIFTEQASSTQILLTTLGANSITVFTAFSFIYWQFDTRLWKVWPFCTLHSIPNLSGSWTGYIDVEGEKGRDKIFVEIGQTWTKFELILELDNKQAFSESESASLTTQRRRSKLAITYMSRQQGEGMEERDHHEGVNWFTLQESDSQLQLKGRYFTDPVRESQGLISLKREK